MISQGVILVCDELCRRTGRRRLVNGTDPQSIEPIGPKSRFSARVFHQHADKKDMLAANDVLVFKSHWRDRAGIPLDNFSTPRVIPFVCCER